MRKVLGRCKVSKGEDLVAHSNFCQVANAYK
jgi:hypothetical protein